VEYFLPNPPELKGVFSLFKGSAMRNGKSFNFQGKKTRAQIPVVHELVVGILASDLASLTVCLLICKGGPATEEDRGLGLRHP